MNIKDCHKISYLTDIFFGCKAIECLEELMMASNLKRPMVITDDGIVNCGYLEMGKLTSYPKYDKVETNPTENQLIEAAEIYKDEACDSIIAIGGGSSIDLAKVLGLYLTHPEPLESYSVRANVAKPIKKLLPPLVAIPTTAGSGSEVGRAALLTLKNGKKVGFISPFLLPMFTLCDPELTISLPVSLTAGTGMDAITHCIESYLSLKYNPVADAIVLDGFKRGYENIREATFNGKNIDARKEMMMCSIQGGMGFQKGLGAVHSLSHPLGALTSLKLHHGMLNALFLPDVLSFNVSHCYERLQHLSNVIGMRSVDEFIESIQTLNKDIKIPESLDLKLSCEELSSLSHEAYEDHCSVTNPRPFLAKDAEGIYQKILK